MRSTSCRSKSSRRPATTSSARLKKAHQAEVAAEIRALKKPSAVAWSANSLVRTDGELVGRAPRRRASACARSQQRALQGNADADDVGEAAAAEREAVRALLAAARKRLGARATPALLDRLGQTLRAAAVDDQGRVLLERGRLTEELKAVGFGPLEAVKPSRRARRRGGTRGARARLGTARRSAPARRVRRGTPRSQRSRPSGRGASSSRRPEQKRAEAERAAAELAEAEESLRKRR